MKALIALAIAALFASTAQAGDYTFSRLAMIDSEYTEVNVITVKDGIARQQIDEEYNLAWPAKLQDLGDTGVAFNYRGEMVELLRKEHFTAQLADGSLIRWPGALRWTERAAD